MAQEKVYRILVELEVHGQTSKAAALDYVLESVCDGIIVTNTSKVKLLKPENQCATSSSKRTTPTASLS